MPLPLYLPQTAAVKKERCHDNSRVVEKFLSSQNPRKEVSLAGMATVGSRAQAEVESSFVGLSEKCTFFPRPPSLVDYNLYRHRGRRAVLRLGDIDNAV